MLMKAVRVAKFGGPEVLQVLKDVAVPKPSTKEVLIKVKAAGVNPVDTYIRSGTYARKPPLPYTPGGDGAGVIYEIGPEVSKFKAGDKVWFYGSVSGSYAEISLCKESNVFPLPETIDFEQGAAIGAPFLTAYRALFHKCHAKAGESVLIHGATGGVGTAACQLAHMAGLRVLGTAGSDAGKELLKKIGVDVIFNHRTENYAQEIMAATDGQGVDIIIEMLANVNLDKDLKMLKRNGRVGPLRARYNVSDLMKFQNGGKLWEVIRTDDKKMQQGEENEAVVFEVVGSRGTVEVNPRDAMSREASIHGVMLFSSNQEETAESIAFITRGLEKQLLRPAIGQIYSMEDVSAAHKDIIETNGAKGKVLLLI